jgi:hypothetical protein
MALSTRSDQGQQRELSTLAGLSRASSGNLKTERTNRSRAPFRDILAASPKLIFAQRQQSTFAIVSQTSGLRIN